MNPMTPVAVAYREILYYKRVPDLGNLLWAFLVGILSIAVGAAVFARLQKNFVEEL